MQDMVSDQRLLTNSSPGKKQLQQLLAEESTQVPIFKLGILLLLFAGNLVEWLLTCSDLCRLMVGAQGCGHVWNGDVFEC